MHGAGQLQAGMMNVGGQAVPVIVVPVKRDFGRRTQIANVEAGRSIANIVRSTLGPKSLLKMLLDPLGGITITNDGNAILREIDVTHPAAKSLIELCRAQDEEVGDGTTSVVIVTGEILGTTLELLTQNVHPTAIVKGYLKALEDALALLDTFAVHLDLHNEGQVSEVIKASMGTKFSAHWGQVITSLALEAVKTVEYTQPNGRKEIDVKRYARVEKLPGGSSEDCHVVRGIMINKDVTHAKMKRIIRDPRVVLLDCPLEYKKSESMTNVEITQEEEFEKLLLQEEHEVKTMIDHIVSVGCDLVITEKGVSDLAAHYLIKAGISAIRRVKKSDCNRIARATSATIVNRVEELTEKDVGHGCHSFSVKKIDDDYWAFLSECDEPKACTVVLRGGSKDSLNEIERNLHDALNVARNIMLEGKLLPGGGASEMELSMRMQEKALELPGIEQWGYRAVAEALEVIPRTLAQNCGADVVRVMADLRAEHSAAKPTSDGVNMGIDGVSGKIVNVTKAGIWDTFAVKAQILKTAIECSAMLMRVDDILSGIGKKKDVVPEIENYNTSPEMEAVGH